MKKTTPQLVILFLWFILVAAVSGCGSDDKPNESGNNPPTIQSITADPDTFHMSEFSTITVIAEDPDGDELHYTWNHRHGESILEWVSASGNTAMLTTCGCVIAEPLNAWVISTVDDGRGGEATDSVSIVVLQ
jgi:hypothetical protein